MGMTKSNSGKMVLIGRQRILAQKSQKIRDIIFGGVIRLVTSEKITSGVRAMGLIRIFRLKKIIHQLTIRIYQLCKVKAG